MARNNIQTYLFTWLWGQYIGTDSFGNRYYQHKKSYSLDSMRAKRWVIYKNEAEASAIPAAWHGWLHHIIQDANQLPQSYIAHQQNASGTAQAYYPPAHLINPQLAKQSITRYEAWQPFKE